MEFSDFSIPKEYKSFMGHDEYFEYLNNYTNHFDLKNMIKVNIYYFIR